MGRDNRERRAAKARAKARSRAGAGGGRAPGGWQEPAGPGRHPPGDDRSAAGQAELARALLVRAAQWRGQAGVAAARRHDDLASLPPAVLDAAAEALLVELVASAWAGGWQPAELHRQGRIGCATAPAGRLVAVAIATDHVGRRSTTLDGRWVAQVDGLGLPPVDGRPGWLGRWAQAEGLDRSLAVAALVDASANLMGLPRLEVLLPPPGSAAAARSADTAGAGGGGGGGGGGGAEVDPILKRIRALLAKAESTTFEAEATAFTAKAQELMTRHAVDAAMVQGAGRRDGEAPVVIRVPVDAPYADIKSLLLQTVADAGRCRSVFLDGLAMSSVIGFAADLAAVELLFTSLLLQAQTALADAARTAPAGTRTRSQRYRSAFLVAYTHRIGDRLAEINDAVYAEAEAERGASFLPVLRSRAEAVDDVMAERFSTVSRSRVRGGYDAAGWASGRLAADHARLGSGEVAAQA